MGYKFKRTKSTPKAKPHKDFFKEVEDLGWKNLGNKPLKYLDWDMRSPVKKRNAERKCREKLLASGYKMVLGTLEQTVYIKGPPRGVWNRVESL